MEASTQLQAIIERYRQAHGDDEVGVKIVAVDVALWRGDRDADV